MKGKCTNVICKFNSLSVIAIDFLMTTVSLSFSCSSKQVKLKNIVIIVSRVDLKHFVNRFKFQFALILIDLKELKKGDWEEIGIFSKLMFKYSKKLCYKFKKSTSREIFYFFLKSSPQPWSYVFCFLFSLTCFSRCLCSSLYLIYVF